MKVVFFGSSKYVVPILNLLGSEHQLLLVVTTEQGTSEPVNFFCRNNRINCIKVRKTGDLLANYELHKANADIGIVADFGIIIPQNILNLFPKGLINIHPSLLPKYRGAAPVQNTILNGDLLTGVSIIQLDKEMDHGPVLAQKEEPVNPDDTAKTLYEKLFKEGAILLSQVLLKCEHNNLTPVQQDHIKATFTKPLKREDGYFEIKELEIEIKKQEIYRKIKAYYPWPGVWTKVKLNERDEKILKFLPDKLLQVEGKKEMSYKDFINGYPQADAALLNFLRKEIQ